MGYGDACDFLAFTNQVGGVFQDLGQISAGTAESGHALHDSLTEIGDAADTTRPKVRKFTETVELQVGLKDYDPQKDKRFVGTVRLPNNPRPTLKLCIIADEKQIGRAHV